LTRARKVCSQPNCPQLQPCPDHAPKPWAGSQRRERTISGSAQQRRALAVMHLHEGICHVCHRPGSDEVDHVICLSEGGPDTMDNLRPIHSEPCHSEKTQAEAQRARGVRA
jgi:5-methylcytosine-specific restriction endonuclease McrA